MYRTDDTIAAVASAFGPAVRGIVRISGPCAMSILATCFRPRAGDDVSAARTPTILPGTIALRSSAVRELPADLLLWPTRRSYTREPMAELHTIGSPPLVSAALATVCAAGARLAEPGEFTLRAFLAGRIDLAQAEAVLAVIEARDQTELQTALAQLAGGLTRPLDRLRESLVELLAHIEAGLDFVEEGIEFIRPDEIQNQLDEAARLVSRITAQLAERGRRDPLPRAVLVGRPNVGKSSLFNALVAGGSALVSNQPGTTRDYLTAAIDLEGVRCQLVDTAGAEPPDDAGDGSPGEEIGRSAQRLAAAQAGGADLCLLCLDSTDELTDHERQELAANPDRPRLVVLTKCESPRRLAVAPNAIETSAHGGQGLDHLRAALRRAIVELARGETAGDLSADRCGESLRRAGESLARAAALNRSGAGEELIGSELRVALDELSRVVGAVYTEDILERIFSRFCIGK